MFLLVGALHIGTVHRMARAQHGMSRADAGDATTPTTVAVRAETKGLGH